MTGCLALSYLVGKWCGDSVVHLVVTVDQLNTLRVASEKAETFAFVNGRRTKTSRFHLDVLVDKGSDVFGY